MKRFKEYALVKTSIISIFFNKSEAIKQKRKLEQKFIRNKSTELYDVIDITEVIKNGK